MFGEEVIKLRGGGADAVAIPRDYAVGRQGKRARIGMDVTYEESEAKKEETEEEEEAPTNV